MQVRVLFFGATADEAGVRSIPLSISSQTDVHSALEEIFTKFPRLRSRKLLYAVNQEYDSSDRKLNDGDELAIFTAVSGG